MKAIQIREHGGPDVLELVELPEPVPGPGEILIEVESAAVNWSDTMRRRNDPYPFETPLPFVPGGEVAGTVVALGDGVDGPAPGTPVFALAGPDGSGGYAERVVAGAPMVIPRPPSVTADEAAAILVAGGTAAIMLREAARLAPGETVLVEGAGGGVGTYAIQLAKAFGAGTVIAAAGSGERRARAVAVGADHAVDYTSSTWADEVRDLSGGGVDVVLEAVGGDVFHEAFATLGPFGRMVVYGYASGRPAALTADEQFSLYYRPVLNQTVSGFNIGAWFGLRPERAVAVLGELVELVARREIEVQIGERLSLSDAAEAHRRLEARTSVGKIVLRPH